MTPERRCRLPTRIRTSGRTRAVRGGALLTAVGASLGACAPRRSAVVPADLRAERLYEAEAACQDAARRVDEIRIRRIAIDRERKRSLEEIDRLKKEIARLESERSEASPPEEYNPGGGG